MSPRQIVAVALRLFAVWLVLQTLRTLPALIVSGASEGAGYIYETFMFALTAATCVALWFFPSIIAGKLLPRSGPTAESKASADTWLAMGCTLIGIWTLTSTIPRLLFDVLALKSASAYDEVSQYYHWVESNVVELAIGVWLLFGAKGLRKLFWWAQDAGTHKVP